MSLVNLLQVTSFDPLLEMSFNLLQRMCLNLDHDAFEKSFSTLPFARPR